MLVAVFAISAVVASAASAAAPEFKPSTKQAFTGSSGTLTIETTSLERITCSKVTSTGEITGASTVGAVVLTLTECNDKEGAGCKLKTEGAKEGEIVTNALVGTLGEVKTTEATSGVGLLLEPASGKVWAKVEGPCIPIGSGYLEGSLAAEVTPIKTLAKTAKLVFVGGKGVNKIRTVVIKGKETKPRLKGPWANECSWDTTETLTFKSNAVEIT